MNIKLQEYKNAAILRAIGKVSGEVLNDGLDYANILIETMIGLCATSDEVFIYSGSLPRTSYDLAFRMTSATSIKVIVDDASNLQWLSTLPAEALNRISLHKINRPRPNHFFFTSSGAYRIERERDTFKADGDFNNPAAITQLKTAFNALLGDSQPIATPQPIATGEEAATGT